MSRLENNISALGLFAGKVEDKELKDKLFNVTEEMMDNISKLRLVANGCSAHKSYRGHRPPKDCDTCQEIYDARQFLGE